MKINYNIKKFRLPRHGELVEINRDHPNYKLYKDPPWALSIYKDDSLRDDDDTLPIIETYVDVPHLRTSSHWSIPIEVIKLIPNED